MRTSERAKVSTAALAAAVRGLFQALDDRDASAFRRAFVTGARVVHDNGVETTVAAVSRRLRTERDTRLRTRRLGRFHSGGDGEWAWIGYENRLTVSVGQQRQTLRFTETAVLRRGGDGVWRFARIHYSGERPAQAPRARTHEMRPKREDPKKG
jgi:hypothetical protein